MGKTKRGKGTKIMAVSDSAGFLFPFVRNPQRLTKSPSFKRRWRKSS